ncbi:MAG TPA: Rid family detoxifying hydrolase [Paenalcaligenes sp.]|nr:Rid family detoxifying hydrolase [Paenalcaligenes sp.]
MTKKVVFTDKAPAAVGPYSQAIVAPQGRTLYISGQLPLDLNTGELVSENFEAQARQAFENMQAVLAAEGATFEHVVKFSLFLTDLSMFASVNAIMAELVPEPFPARSTIGVASLPKGAQFEVEAIAVIPQ